MREIVRSLSLEERATWGECLSCGARHGERCRKSMQSTEMGVHIGRIRGSPIRVRVIPIFSSLPQPKGPGDMWVPVAEVRA